MKKIILLMSAMHILPGIFSCADHITEYTDTIFNDQNNPPVIIAATFTAIQNQVFTPKCALSGCHDGSVTPDLSSGLAYDMIINRSSIQKPGQDFIEPGSADRSYLYLKLLGGGNIIGAQMPYLELPLSGSINDSIRVWIERGALRN